MFISIEGPEGSGKTSVMNAVVERLRKEGFPIVYTREPGGTPIAEAIRAIILDKKNTALDARAEALLYAASRRQHLVEKVWPNIQQGKIVLCDRFIDSSLAYQGGGRELGVEAILNINLFATEGVFPDLTVLFDIAPEVGLERINASRKREVNRLDLEKLSFHQKVRSTFLSLAKQYPKRFVILDASATFDKVLKEAYQVIVNKIKKS
jgi:dTMP kinase